MDLECFFYYIDWDQALKLQRALEAGEAPEDSQIIAEPMPPIPDLSEAQLTELSGMLDELRKSLRGDQLLALEKGFCPILEPESMINELVEEEEEDDDDLDDDDEEEDEEDEDADEEDEDDEESDEEDEDDEDDDDDLGEEDELSHFAVLVSPATCGHLHAACERADLRLWARALGLEASDESEDYPVASDVESSRAFLLNVLEDIRSSLEEAVEEGLGFGLEVD